MTGDGDELKSPADFRADVDFLIVGAYKSGTTSLYKALASHPDIDMASIQEPNYFARPPEPSPPPRGYMESNGYRRPRAFSPDEYEALFPPRRQGHLRGDCSPEYMRNPHAVGRIAASVPGVRVIALLRNPIERALSDYSMFVRDGLETATFSEAIRRPQSDRLLDHYVYTGYYGQQLQRYYDALPPESIRVVLFEDFIADRAPLATLLGWLGAEDLSDELDSDVHNASGRPRNRAVAGAYVLRRKSRKVLKPMVPAGLQQRVDTLLASGLEKLSMSQDDRDYLRDLYSDDVAQLSGLVGRDLNGWLT